MTQRFAPVVVAAVFTFASFPSQAQQQMAPVTDRVAYSVYAALLPTAWAAHSGDTLLLQQETEGIAMVEKCGSRLSDATPDGVWDSVHANFMLASTQVRVLERLLPVEIPYRLIPRADILADDARLALKYPGTWLHRPESMEYAAVSAVGFDATKTKAMVYVRLRSSGVLHSMELREGKWIPAKRNGCAWIA